MVTASAVAIRTCNGEMLAIGLRAVLATERTRSPGRGERLTIPKPRGPRLRVQRLVRFTFRATWRISAIAAKS
jgi:hypothetical protein